MPEEEEAEEPAQQVHGEGPGEGEEEEVRGRGLAGEEEEPGALGGSEPAGSGDGGDQGDEGELEDQVGEGQVQVEGAERDGGQGDPDQVLEQAEPDDHGVIPEPRLVKGQEQRALEAAAQPPGPAGDPEEEGEAEQGPGRGHEDQEVMELAGLAELGVGEEREEQERGQDQERVIGVVGQEEKDPGD